MTDSPQPSRFRPERAILTLGPEIYDPVAAADFPETRLRFRNQRHARRVGLDDLGDDRWIAHFGRFEPLPGSLDQPLALRYHGHQFRVYNPDIGDGRGFLFAQLRGDDGRLLDLGTKGSGTTPYSRFGDGRLTLKGGVREILATEMLEALGVNTSKTFSLIETGERLHRGDEPSPARSAVMVRLSHGHIRIGSFQRLALLRDADMMRTLTHYALRMLLDIEPGDDPAVQLLDAVATRTATLAAQYMVAGFVHGVLNTDNINVTGESFDYGPWRFTPRWTPGFTAAYFDHQGLYAFGRQAQVIHWNLVQLALSLRLIADPEPLAAAVDRFAATYESALRDGILRRLRVAGRGDERDFALIAAIEAALGGGDVEIDRFFFDWAGGRRRAPSPADALYAADRFAAFTAAIADYEAIDPLDHPYWSEADPCSMYIEEVESIWSAIAERDDWQPLTDKVDRIRSMGAAIARS